MVEVIDDNNSCKDNKSQTLETPSKEQQRAEKISYILGIIKQNQGISSWDLEKITKTPHSTIYYLLRDLEFAGAVWSKVMINKYNRTVRLFYTARENRNEQKNVGEKSA